MDKEKEFRDELKKWLEDEIKLVCEEVDEYRLAYRVKNKITELEKDIGLV